MNQYKKNRMTVYKKNTMNVHKYTRYVNKQKMNVYTDKLSQTQRNLTNNYQTAHLALSSELDSSEL